MPAPTCAPVVNALANSFDVNSQDKSALCLRTQAGCAVVETKQIASFPKPSGPHMVDFLHSDRVDFDGTWAIIKGMSEDLPYFLRIRTDLGIIAGEQSMSLLFELRWMYFVSEEQIDEMPTPVQQDEMSVFENTVVNALSGGRAALLVAVQTSQGSRAWFWYCTDRDKVEQCVNAALAGDPAFPITMTVTEDSEWSFYRNWIDVVESA